MAAAWEDTDAEGTRRRELLQEVSDRLVLITVRLAHRRGLFKGWRGDIAADTTPIPSWHQPPQERRGLASVELTADWHYCGGSEDGLFGHSASLLVASSRRHPTGHPQAGERVSRHPQLALGLVLDTPGKRIGPNAVHSLARLSPFGFPTGLLAADRAYTDQITEHFARPVRTIGYQLVLDYKQQHRGVQGTHQGALLVDGSLVCPAMPDALARATAGLDDRAVRGIDDSPKLSDLIAAREPYFLRLKESADQRGAIRLQCPASGPSPAVSCRVRASTRSTAFRHRGRPSWTSPTNGPPPHTLRPSPPSRSLMAHGCGPCPGRAATDLPEAHDHRPARRPRQARQVPPGPALPPPHLAGRLPARASEHRRPQRQGQEPRHRHLRPHQAARPRTGRANHPPRSDDLQYQPAHPLRLAADRRHPSDRDRS